MLVQIGPVEREAAEAWLVRARSVVARARADSTVLGFDVPEDALDDFEQCLGAWERAGDGGAEWRWSAAVDVDVAVHVVVVLLRMAQAAARGPAGPSDPEGGVFSSAVAAALLSGLQHQGRSLHEFATHVRPLLEAPPAERASGAAGEVSRA